MNLPVPVSSFDKYMAEIQRFPLLTREEEQALSLEYYENQNQEAAHKLALANLRFVVKIAHEYKAYGLKLSDLVQEGNIGLLHAIKKFDPNKGVRLISYAVWWIRAYIQNYILRSWSLVKIGTTQAQRKLFYKLKQTKQKLLSVLGEDPDVPLNESLTEAIAKKLSLKTEEVAEMDQRLSARDSSLDAPVFDDSQQTRMDLLPGIDNPEANTAALESQEQAEERVSKALRVLNDRERIIVQERLMSDEPKTLQELGDHFGISRERARQLEARAKEKLREALAA